MQSPETPETPEVPWMKNLAACANQMKEQGYKEDYKVNEKGLITYDQSKTYKPEQIRIVNFYRFEGESDPGDSSVLYVIETDDGGKGTLADGYGAYADKNVSDFIVEVEKIQKIKETDLHT